MPHLLFRTGDVTTYLENLDAALDATVDELGEAGTVDVFAVTRRLGHRMGLESWDPDRWRRHRLADTSALASPQLVTAFGHGRHSCPAQPFSLAAMSAAVSRLFGEYDLAPGWTGHPGPVPAQIGGVARASSPCPVGYRRRGGR